MKLNLALAAALSLSNNNVISISAELAAEEIEELNTLFAEELHLEQQNEEIIQELSSLTQTRFDVDPLVEEEEGEMVAQSDTLEGGEEDGGDIVLNFDAPDLRVEEEGEGYDELPEDGIAYTTSAMEEDNSSDDEEEEAVHVPTKHELHHAAKIAAKANKDMLSKAHSMKSVEKKHSKAAKAIHHGSKGSKRGKMGKAHLSMPTHSSGKANKMVEPIHHEAKTQKTPSATVKSTSQSASSSKANKVTDSSTEEAMPVPMPVEEESSGNDNVTELNMEPVPRTPDVSPAHHTGVDTSELNGRLKQEMAEVMLGDTSHVGKGHSQSNENVAALDLLRAKSDAAAQSNGGVVGRRSVGIVGGVCLVGSILYGMM